MSLELGVSTSILSLELGWVLCFFPLELGGGASLLVTQETQNQIK